MGSRYTIVNDTHFEVWVVHGCNTAFQGRISDEEQRQWKKRSDCHHVSPGSTTWLDGTLSLNQRVWVMDPWGCIENKSVWTGASDGSNINYYLSDSDYFPHIAERAAEIDQKVKEYKSHAKTLKDAENEMDNFQVKYDLAMAAVNPLLSQRKAIQAKIDVQEKALQQKLNVAEITKDSAVIVLLGMTGAGKSTVSNRLMGDESRRGNEGKFATSGKATSCTQENGSHSFTLGDRRVTIVDTPGFNDSMGKDSQHSNSLCDYLRGCGGINAFVLVRNGTNVRNGKDFQDLMKQYNEMFGAAFFENLIIIATRIESYDKDDYDKSVFTEDIIKRYNVKKEIPVIPFGFDKEDLKKQRQALVNAIPKDRKQFDNITSPIDKLKEDLKSTNRKISASPYLRHERNLNTNKTTVHDEKVWISTNAHFRGIAISERASR